MQALKQMMCLLLSAAAFGWAIPTASWAGPVPLSDTVTVIDPLQGPLDFTLPEDGTAEYLPTFYGPLSAPAQVIQFNEPGTHIASDYLWIDMNGFLNFESDQPEDVLPIAPVGPGVATIDETGQPQEVGHFFFTFQNTPLPLQIFVTSDLDMSVPEPSTFVTLGLGIISLQTCRRRKRFV